MTTPTDNQPETPDLQAELDAAECLREELSTHYWFHSACDLAPLSDAGAGKLA